MTQAAPFFPKITFISPGNDPGRVRPLQEAFGRENLRLQVHSDSEDQIAQVFRETPGVVLLDWVPPVSRGLALVRDIAEGLPGTAIILLADSSSIKSAMEAIEHGATDVLHKPVPAETLRQRIAQIVRTVDPRQIPSLPGRAVAEQSAFRNIVGSAPRMLEVFASIRQVAPYSRTVLLTGETGTGKELAARAIHDLSPRRGGPFAACNCSALVETLFESELFGYAKGAFTDARQDKQGLLEYVQGGTLLLDEIGDMPLGMQAKLLRVLQDQEFHRLGSPVPCKIDIRFIAATNRDLRARVGSGEFRKDLFYRLSMVEIRLPRLIERKEDLPLLERHFLDRFGREFRKTIHGIAPGARALLAAYGWPGNVRELENVLGHACMMTSSEIIDLGDFPPHLLEQSTVLPAEQETVLPLEEFERSYVRRVLISFDGNKVRTAEALRISRSKLYSLISTESQE